MVENSREALVELAERAEKAEGASRSLNIAVWLDAVEKPEGKRDRDMIGREPNFTGSIDAATTLFPPNTMIRSGHSALAPDPIMFFCDAVTEDGRDFHALALTEANARVAAALRARAAS